MSNIVRIRVIAVCFLTYLVVASVQAQIPLSQATGAQNPSPELIGNLTRELSITPEQAIGGSGALFGLSKNRLKPEEFAKVSDVVPGMDGLLSAAPKQASGIGAISSELPGKPGGLEALNSTIPGKPGELGAKSGVLPGKPGGVDALTNAIPGKPGGVDALTNAIPGKPGGVDPLTNVIPSKPGELGAKSSAIPGKMEELGAMSGALPGKGGLAPVKGSFKSLGLSPEMASKFVPIMTRFIEERGGASVGNLFAGSLK